jgi:uncharacterized protein with von Willebrand factor type A (vWA) domain
LSTPTGRLALLVASMRAGGARVGIRELLTAHRALGVLDATDHEAAYRALRAALCSRRDDVAPFDAAFAEWFSSPAPVEDTDPLWEKDFAEYGEAERRTAQAVMQRLAAGPPRRSPRTRPALRRGAPWRATPPDLRRTIRSALRTGGDPSERHWREPGDRPRPLVVVCDGSRSMEPYTRMLLQYTRACAAAQRRVETFVFGSRLPRVTADPRDAIVVLLSDRWDRVDPEQLSAELARLGRRAHSLVWLNPLQAHPAREPLSAGMQAALPHVDHLLAGNSLASFEELAQLMDDGLE